MEKERPTDDLDALRQVLAALEPLEARDRERVVRWACEKLELSGVQPAAIAAATASAIAPAAPAQPSTAGRPQDIKAFVQEKSPATDAQFIATVAYYHQFVAPQADRKVEISGEDLQEATRLASRDRFKKPIKALHNALHAGLLDKGSVRGTFKVSTVGENLVAMALPGGNGGGTGRPPRRSAKGGRGAKAPARRGKR